MSSENKIPSLTTLFHSSDESLERNFFDWYQLHKNGDNEDFNSQYSIDSPELEMEYDSKLIDLSFKPLIEAVNQYVNPLKKSQLLEIGGASGLLAINLQDRGADITLLETQKNFGQKAEERGVKDVRIYDGNDLTKSIFAGETFAAVIASRVFEDIVMSEEKARRLMKQVKTMLEPDGVIIIGTKNKDAVWHQVIERGSQLKLLSSNESPNNDYIKQVYVYGNSK